MFYSSHGFCPFVIFPNILNWFIFWGAGHKSFRDKTEIEIKPITIFVGPNSAGKSNILKLFGLLSQSYKQRKTILSLSGNSVDLGNLNSFAYNSNQNNVQIDFELQSYVQYLFDGSTISDSYDNFYDTTNRISQFRISNMLSEFKAYYKGESSIEEYSKNNKPINTNEIEFWYNQKYLSIVDLYKNEVLKKLNPALKDLEQLFIEAKKLNISLKQKSFDDFLNIALQDFLTIPLDKCGIDFELNNDIFHVAETYPPYYWGRLDFEASELREINRAKLYEHPFEYKAVDLELALKDLFLKLRQLENKKHQDYLIKITLDELYILIREITKDYLSFIRREIGSYYTTVRYAFDRIDYFSSLRSNPKRYYTKEEFENEVLAGKSIDIIEDKKFQKQLNNYLSIIGINYRIEIDKIQNKKNIPTLYTVNLIDLQNKQIINYPDVGFGLSQTIPFLITLATYIHQHKNTFVIHQPELHLHPNSTAKLANVFLLATNKNENTIIMETHSEHLIRGFQVLVAQGKLKPEDIAVYYIDKNKEGVSTKQELRIDQQGFFIDEWPEGFMDISFKQSLALSAAQK